MKATLYKVTAIHAHEGYMLGWALDEIGAKEILDTWTKAYGALGVTVIQTRQVTLTRHGVLSFLRVHCPERDNG